MKHKAKALTVTSAGGRLRELRSQCRISAAFDPGKTPVNARPDSCEVNALWDTGASNSAISPAVVKALGLAPVGMINVSTANGKTQCATYLVNLMFPHGVEIAGLMVSGIASEEVLIGMDVITLGDFSITNYEDKTVFSFRVPSLHSVDYVVETNRAIEKNKKKQAKKKRRSRGGKRR